MKIAVNQPNYIPWLGYFDLIDTVDKFIFLDDVEYSRNSVISRNKISDIDGKSRWLSLSLKKTSFHDLIYNKSLLTDSFDSHLKVIASYYRKTPYFDEVFDFFYSTFKNQSSNYLSTININLIVSICKFIGIKCDFATSSKIKGCNTQKGTKKIFCLIDQFKYTQYYNFAKGVDIGLYDKKDFSKKGKLLFKQEYLHPKYARPNFQPFMSILDLLFYELPNSLEIIRRGRNWKLMNPGVL